MRHRCAQKKGEKKNKREEAEKWNLTHEGRNEEIKRGKKTLTLTLAWENVLN